MADEFLTVAEIASVLKLNQQTVRNWIDRGELTAVRIGSRRVRVRRDDFDTFVAGRAAGQPGPESDRRETLETRLGELEARVEALERICAPPASG